LVVITDQIWLQNATLIATQTAANEGVDPLTVTAPRPPVSDAQAVV
jgi:hypothetical protein